MITELTIRELTSEDYDAIAEFNSSFPGDTRNKSEWLARFKYWWDENPAYDDTWKRGFILADEDVIVGFVGSFPTLFKAGDIILKVFNGTTWRVLEKYRKWSIDLWDKNRDLSDNYLSFNTTPTIEVARLISKIGYKHYPMGIGQFSFLISDHASFIDNIPFPYHRFVKCCISIVIKLAQQLSLLFVKTPYQVRDKVIQLSDIDDLWDKTSHQAEYTNIRNSLAIEWYSKGKSCSYVYHGSILVAIAIYLSTEGNNKDSKILTMVDYWYEHSQNLAMIIGALIRFDSAQAKRQGGISMVKYPHYTTSLSSVLKRRLLLTYRYTNSGFMRQPRNSSLPINANNSYFTLLQGDLGA